MMEEAEPVRAGAGATASPSSAAGDGDCDGDDHFVAVALGDHPVPGHSTLGDDAGVAPLPEVKSSEVPAGAPKELPRLVDSAIMGSADGIARLRDVISDPESSADVASSVVDMLLATMGGPDTHDDDGDRISCDGMGSPPSVISNSRAAVVAAEMLAWLPWEGDDGKIMSPRTRLVNGLYSVLCACTRNRALCSSSALLPTLLNSVEEIARNAGKSDECWDGTVLCKCIEVLGGHSLSVRHLDVWLCLIKKVIMTDWAMQLILALEKAMGSKETKGPAVSFEFDGESSGLLGPGDSRWPFTNGYGFATWIYVESFSDTLNTATAAAAIAAAAAAKSGKSSAMSAAAAASALAGEGTTHMPRLFSFLSSDNQGIEAYFHGQFLVVEGGNGKGKKASLHFTHAFKPQCWYFVGLEHNWKQGLIGKAESELRLYIDGKLYESRPFEFPRISKPLAFCCIGTNPPPTIAGLQRRRRQCPLFAEMGPIYIFKEPIGPEAMSRFASRGGDFLPSFGHGAGSPWLATNDQCRRMAEENFLLDLEIGGHLYLLYHPRLLNGRFCPDASPSGAAGTLRRDAQVLGQVHVAHRVRPADSLWALGYGGPMALLPLSVSNVQIDSLEPLAGSISLSLSTTAMSAPIFRIMSLAVQQPGNIDEFCHTRAPELLSRVLQYLLHTLSSEEFGKDVQLSDEELVAALVTFCQSQKDNFALKVQLFSSLLLDLQMWCCCTYGLQKKLLSSLADMVFTESDCMRNANALQMLLDGCRRCYWVVRESDSLDTFSCKGSSRHVGDVNSLVDELLVVIELLIGAASSSLAADDVRSLLGFIVDCSQPNQVARILHLMYRLIVQPNVSRASVFAQSFISCGGVEAFLVLLQREVKIGDCHFDQDESAESIICDANEPLNKEAASATSLEEANSTICDLHEPIDKEAASTVTMDETNGQDGQTERDGKSFIEGGAQNETVTPAVISDKIPVGLNAERTISSSEKQLLEKLGGISFSISAENARNNSFNIDSGDGVVIGIIRILGALVSTGHLKFLSDTAPDSHLNSSGSVSEEGASMFEDKLALLLFALHKAFQAAPRRLMTPNVYMALISATINVSSADESVNLYDSGHRFEHTQLLLVLLRSLPYASRSFQARAVQDLLLLACSHPENRSTLMSMAEWPEWLLEVLISNYEMGESKHSNGVSVHEIEDLIHNFLIIMMEHSMRQKDGWKDVEATIHCAEWLSMVGGSSTGDQRIRREESLPIFKRRLLGGLLDFASRELQDQQTEVIAAAAAGVAAEGLSPKEAKLQAENAVQLSIALAENAIVILMLVEDHLRLQGQHICGARSVNAVGSPAAGAAANRSNPLSRTSSGSVYLENEGSRRVSLSSESGSLPLDVLASMADSNGQISATIMERLTAAAAAEPYESVRHAFVSYGSCALDLAEGWKFRSRLWYGVGLPPKSAIFGGGGSGWESWNSVIEKDSDGTWVEWPLVKKSIAMLQALLLDDSGLGGGLGIGGGSGTGMGAMTGLYQFLDSDQPFLCMLRMVLVSMRENDSGNDDGLMRSISIKDGISEGLGHQTGSPSTRRPRSALLWSVLTPILNMPISESKRQRVLVASSILFSEVWHAITRDRKPLRKQYIESIVPPFVAILRRWRPLLAGIHELTSADGQNPLVVDDRSLAADALPLEAALLMISPGWAAAFASPPAAMALAMVAAGAAGTEVVQPPKNTLNRRETSLLERKPARLQNFYSFQKPIESHDKPPTALKDKVSAKAAAQAAARDLERTSKIGSGRGLSAVAMATSAQRRSAGDFERAKRWSISEGMNAAWCECLQSADSKTTYGRDMATLSYKYVAILVSCFALARNMQRAEMDRRVNADVLTRNRVAVGTRAWRSLIRRLIEMNRLYGPFGEFLCTPNRIFWKLDFTESSSRMRRFMKRNYKGSDHLGAAADYDERKSPRPTADSKAHQGEDEPSSLTSTTASIIMTEALSIDIRSEDTELLETENLRYSMDEHQQSSTVDQYQKGSVGTRNSAASGDHSLVNATVSPIHVPSEADERIIVEFPALMVRPLKVVHGTFQITSKKINFIIDAKGNNSSTEDRLPASQYTQQDKDRSWFISSLHQIYSRRYLLRRSALELFMADRSNFFFDFGNVEARKNAYRAIIQTRPPYLSDIFLATQRPEQILKRTQLMERWARWEISNFEYLMELNTLAGRSYNDITQYPVFPWIIADYSSNELNLEDPVSFRDLSKPIGALNDERLKKFQERYSTFEDPIIPKFHYGSHYSSAGTVLYYLVRVEPFTTLSIQLQGGKFDHADRMFFDISSTWNGVLEDMSDVKELVPEMFYLPEILTNTNSIDFGTTQLGGKLDSVNLPPWAVSPVDFIRKHRMALESEYVSTHLHEWIDLIFGYKQRGKEAVTANNVFFYITYEGTVDIDKIEDPVQRQATQDQISYFGQTPSQLLNIPHMKRKPLSEVLHLQTIFRNPSGVKSYVVPNSERCNVPAGTISASHDSIVVVDVNAPAAQVAVHKWQPNTPDGQGAPFLFQHGKTITSSGGGALSWMFKGTSGPVEDCQFPKATAFAASGIQSSSVVAVTCDKEIITGGHADNSVKLISSDGAKAIETVFGHAAPVNCLALSADSSYLVTGSRDATVILWRIHRAALSSHMSNPSEASTNSTMPNSPLKSRNSLNGAIEPNRKCRIEGPLHVLRGHLEEVLCCAVCSELGVIVSSSTASGVLLHSLRRGCLLKKLDTVEAHAISLSPQGVILIWNRKERRLSTFTVNGLSIASSVLPASFGRVTCIETSADGWYALIGATFNDKVGSSSTDDDSLPSNDDRTENGIHPNETNTSTSVPSIFFIDLHTLQVFHTLSLEDGQDITAISLNKDNTNLLVSTEDKKLIIFTDPALSLKVTDQMLRLGWEGDGLLQS